MTRFLLFISLFFSLSNAAITLKSVTFDDYEQNASTYLVKYYPYQDFIYIGLSASSSSYVLACRDNDTPTLTCVSNALSSSELMRIREKSHLIDWNVYTNELGMTLHQTNFIFALGGLFLGFMFFYFSIKFVSGRILK
jgi:hypothetical protein